MLGPGHSAPTAWALDGRVRLRRTERSSCRCIPPDYTRPVSPETSLLLPTGYRSPSGSGSVQRPIVSWAWVSSPRVCGR
jgi:hypothetical protein